jgi:hypothetical protein
VRESLTSSMAVQPLLTPSGSSMPGIIISCKYEERGSDSVCSHVAWLKLCNHVVFCIGAMHAHAALTYRRDREGGGVKYKPSKHIS